jgi:hypothetical protein
MKKWSWPNLRYYPRGAVENHMNPSSLVTTVTTCSIKTSYVLCTKSHIHNSSLRSFSKESIQTQGSFRIFITILFFMVRGSPRPNSKQDDDPCWLSAAAYSMHSQLPSIAGGRFLHLQPEETGTHLTWSTVQHTVPFLFVCRPQSEVSKNYVII